MFLWNRIGKNMLGLRWRSDFRDLKSGGRNPPKIGHIISGLCKRVLIGPPALPEGPTKWVLSKTSVRPSVSNQLFSEFAHFFFFFYIFCMKLGVHKSSGKVLFAQIWSKSPQNELFRLLLKLVQSSFVDIWCVVTGRETLRNGLCKFLLKRVKKSQKYLFY